MRITSLFLVFSIVLISCNKSTEIETYETAHQVIPAPKEINTSNKIVLLSATSKMFSTDQSVGPILDLFNSQLVKLFNIDLAIEPENRELADIVFSLDQDLTKEQYAIDINEKVNVKGGSLQALQHAKATLLQLAFVKDGKISFPILSIKDNPDANYRGIMLDLARSWHSVATIKKIIDLASYYKSNFLQLHFTDYRAYTLPSNKYPKLSTPGKHYSFEDLEELEAYAQGRGITIIPEIDIPGHSSAIVNAYPEIFALKDMKENPWIINMGKEEVYQALDAIIGELIPIFKSSPYFHIGGDEAIFNKSLDDPHVKAYMKDKNLGNDVHELYRHFLVRMNKIVKDHGKQMCVWEGFRKEGIVPIPKDIIVFEFETNRYLPNDLVHDGYTVVNTSWKPLYVVNKKKWEPKTIYGWNLWRWENWFTKAPSFDPIQVGKSPLIIGAQMCSWEQRQEVVFKSLRKRLPTMNERIWNTAQKLSYDEFITHLKSTDEKLSILLDDSNQDSLLFDYNFIREE